MSFDLPKIVATTLGTASRVLLARLRGFGSTGDDDNAAPFDDAEVAHPIGYMARPVASATLEAVVWREGDDAIVLAILDKGMPVVSDLEEGEARIYGPKEPSATFRIRASGDIEVTPKAGRKVYVGGPAGGEPIALGDQVQNYLNSIGAAVTGWLATHTHAGVTTGGGTSGPPATLGTLPSVPNVKANNANAL